MKGDKLRSLKRFTKEHLKLKSLFRTTRQECVGNLPPESAVGNFHFRETPHMSGSRSLSHQIPSYQFQQLRPDNVSQESIRMNLAHQLQPLFPSQDMAARPTITVWSAQGESSGSLPLPAVFTAPIRLDVVQQVHSESAFPVIRTFESEASLIPRRAESRSLDGAVTAASGNSAGLNSTIVLSR